MSVVTRKEIIFGFTTTMWFHIILCVCVEVFILVEGVDIICTYSPLLCFSDLIYED